MDKVAVSPHNPIIRDAHVIVYDSTLRDGEQTPGVAFSLEQKIAIARMLDEAHVHQIEAGFPAVSESEVRTIKEITSLGLDADILAFPGSPRATSTPRWTRAWTWYCCSLAPRRSTSVQDEEDRARRSCA